MLNKFLLITLGGSGEKLARYLNQDVEQRLRRGGWERGVPDAWRWLAVDVAHGSDVVENDVPARLGRTGSRLALSRSDMEYRDYHYLVTSNRKALPGLAGALPDPSDELPSPFDGAGQRPQVGHVVGLTALRKLAGAIDRELTALQGVDVASTLADLSHELDPEAPQAQPKTMVMIAGSLGGGSGAGMLQVVVETVLGHPAARQHREGLMTVLFTPDIFADLTAQDREWAQANCLYTTSTLLNGYESRERSEVLDELLNEFGYAADDRRRAAVTNFFVGRGNGTIAFENQDEVIKSTAKAVGRMLVDRSLINGLEAHFRTNREGSAVTANYAIASDTTTSRAASSLGYASISLGDQQLTEYAAERLARAQLDTFARGHKRLQGPDEPDRDAIERIAAEELPGFLARAGLRDEDVRRHLFDRDALKRQIDGHTEKVKGDAGRGALKIEASNWLARLDSDFGSFGSKVEAERESSREGKVDSWCKQAHQRLCEATAEAVGRCGAPVVVELLGAVENHLDGAAGELKKDNDEKLSVQVKQLSTRAREQLAKLKAQKVEAGDPLLDKSSDDRGEALLASELRAYRELSADLLRGAIEGLVTPMRAALEASEVEVSQAEAKQHRALIESWSRHDVGAHIEPAPNQLLLEPLERLPALLDKLLEEATGRPIREAEAAVVEELLARSWRPPDAGAIEDQRPIKVVGAWRLGRGLPASFKLKVSIPGLRDQAEQWVRYRPGPVADRMRLSISEWIRQDPQRAELFADRVEQALGCAAPMLQVNSAVHLRVHGEGPLPPKLHVSTLPIPGEDAYEAVRGRVRETLRRAGVPEGELADKIDGSSEVQVVEVSSFVARPVEPVVAENVFRPVDEDWRSRTDPAMRKQFSKYRRTRPLPLFVPMSREKQRRFAAGWIVAGLLGQRTDFVGDWDRRPVSIWSPEGERLSFPAHLLGGSNPTEEADVLGRVLESLPLAIARFAAERYEELQAYNRVIALGDLSALEEAVLTGVSGPGSAVAGDTFEVRRQRMLDRVAREREKVEAQRMPELTAETILDLPVRHEVAELTLAALDEVRAALEAMGERSFDDDDDMEAALP